jgi:hypothetical protein
MFTRGRSLRAVAAMLIATALVASLAIPAFAKLANVTVTATAVPSSVTPGANVAIDVTFFNSPSTSNISQLYLTAPIPSAPIPSGWSLLGVESITPDQGTCDDTTPTITCSLGAVNAGAFVTVRVVYATPSNMSGTVQLDWFQFNTTGVAGDRHGNSHGDNYPTTGTVTLNTSGDFAGYYTSADQQIVADNPILHARRNPQSTSVTSPDPLIGVMVGEVAGNTFICPPAASTCFGQWSVISVNGGFDYGANGESFTVLLGYKGNIGNASFVHAFDNYDPANPLTYELITYPDDICSDSAPFLPCMTLSSSGGDSYVTLYLTQNGQLKAY